MKKLVMRLCLVALVIFALTGCGKSTSCKNEGCEESVFKNDMCKKHYQDDVFVATWKASYVSKVDEGYDEVKEENITCTLEIYKGGNGNISWTIDGKDGSDVPLNWSVNDDCDVLSVEYDLWGTTTCGYEYKHNTLIQQGETYIVFEKQ